MEMSPSQRKILDEALKLFSINGYEATSIGQIMDAVGIKKASMYSHFKSKQEILDTLIEEITEHYEAYSLFAKNNFDHKMLAYDEHTSLTVEDIIAIVREQVEFLIHDTYMTMTRRFLTIEQFRNLRLADIQNQSVYTDVFQYHKRLIEYLIANDIFVDGNVEMMALEFFAPISVQLYCIQCDPSYEADAMDIVEQHVRHIYKLYSK